MSPCTTRKGEERRKRKGEVLHLFRCYTVTHKHTPGRSWANPERQEEEKSGHRRRAKGQNSAGGEGNERTSRTNLRGETDLTKTEHTHLKPTTHYGEARGEKELGTKWGTTVDGKNIRTLQHALCWTPAPPNLNVSARVLAKVMLGVWFFFVHWG